MSNENNELQTDPNKMQQDIVELRSKYDNLSKEVQQLESNKTTLDSDLKQIHGEFDHINSSIAEILQKLNKLSDEYGEVETEMDEENTEANSMKKFFTNPLRKIAVGTLSLAYAVADMTMEKASNLRESLEDVVAEAQYANKKKKMPSMENS